MNIAELIAALKRHNVTLSVAGSELVVQGENLAADSALINALREQKEVLIDLLSRGTAGSAIAALQRIPANGIVAGSETITPEMLPLVTLNAEQIESIVARVPGGARNIQDIYPLAPLQEGLLFHHLLATEGDPYVLYSVSRFDSRERVEGYISALQGVIDRHDMLRTSVVWEGLPEALQVVWRNAPLHAEEVLLDPADGEIVHQLAARFNPRHYRLDVRVAPMLHVAFAQEHAGGSWVLVHLFHHLVLDHTALEVVQHEIAAYLHGEEEQLPEPVPFRTVVAQARLVGREEHEAFFCAMLEDVSEPTLPFGLANVQGDGDDITSAHHRIESSLSKRLRECARRFGVTPASVCHVAWARVLSVLSGRDDVVFGTVLFGRMQGGAGADRGMGLFLNTLPVRVKMATSVEVGVRQTHAALAQLMYHEHAPLALAQRCSNVAAPTPLFSALLNYRHVSSGGANRKLDGIDVLAREERTNYPVTLSVNDFGEDLSLSAQVDGSLDAQRMCGYMTRALEEVVEALERAPKRSLNDLRVLPETERHEVLVEWNATERPYRSDACVHELFEEQVARAPDAIALVYDEVQVSYGELNARANRLAHYLRSLGIGPESRVALCMERSVALVVAELAVLKAGAAYVPLDEHAPLERLMYVVEDSQVAVVLHDGSRQLSWSGVPLCIDTGSPMLEEYPSDNAGASVGSDGVAYIMYTSGSTGEPKGVVVLHRSVNRLVINNGYADFRASDRIAFAANPAFDASTLEVWAPLLTGGCIVVIGRDVVLSPARFRDVLLNQHVSVLWLTVGLLRQYAPFLSDVFAALRYLIVGGDVVDAQTVAEVLRRGAPEHLLNGYGPTETTTFAATFEIRAIPRGDAIPIGRPIGNTRIYILDERLEPAPVGVAGELYIGGAGVARGYWNRADLTAERFVSSPFVAGDRLYKTGDVGRYLSDGVIEYIGRNDFQVKVRGFRIELGEIESTLRRYVGIDDAVVVARADGDGEKRLVAYYVAAGDARIDAEQLRVHVGRTLPEYMVPAAYVSLESLPLTANGKVDRRALPVPDDMAYSRSVYEAPQGEVEQTLTRIWSELLKVERVGRHDNFFMLGGHSLLVVRLIDRMRLAGLHADVRTLFTASTLMELAEAVGREALSIVVPPNGIVAGTETITPAMLPLVTLNTEQIESIAARVPGGARNVQDIYPLAPLQEGLLFHHLLATEGDPYVLYAVSRFDSRERVERYVSALQGVIDRHDILRTSVVWEGLPEAVQVVWRNAPLHAEEVVLDPAAGEIAHQLATRFDPRHYRLDVRVAPMMHVAFAQEHAGGSWVLVHLFHHLVLDHTALEIVQDEIAAYLHGEEGQLPEPVPFRTVVAQARLGVSREEHEAFFRAMLEDVSEPTLPFGLADVQGDGSGIAAAYHRIESSFSRRLRQCARRLSVSAASVCHVAWARVLSVLSGRDDVVFGTVLFGRMQGGAGAVRGMGLFLNTLPVRVKMATSVEVGVRQTHAALAQLMYHEHAPLVLAQHCSGVAAPAPLFSALLNYRHLASEAVSRVLDGIQPLSSKERTNYPVTLSVNDFGEELSLSAQVDGSLDAQRVCGYMTHALEEVVEALERAPKRSLNELRVLPDAERDQVLAEWNATERPYRLDACVHELFEEQVARTPDAIALVYRDVQVSYGELNARANRLAHYLRSLGVGPESRVALCLERSIEMVVGLLGVLKAGGAYVPLDPSNPLDRLAYMLDDSAPSVALTHAAVPNAVRALLAKTTASVDLVADAHRWERESAENVDRADLRSDSVAYVIYTSGSTGQSKGVMVEHRSCVNRIFAQDEITPMSDLAVFSQKTALGFVDSFFEIVSPLAWGKLLVVIPAADAKNPDALVATLADKHVSNLITVPSLAAAMLSRADVLQHVRSWTLSGEAISLALARDLSSSMPHCRLINLYGSTEVAADVLAYAIHGNETHAIPVGRPMANVRAYVLDELLEPVPVGVAGELHIGGVQVARGYLNRPELTAERFVPSPFVDGDRLYKTGDVVRYLPDGTIEYRGRNDFQVKIRGFRIELGEIESTLRQYAGISDAVVVARADSDGEKRLVAYYVAAADARIDAEQLRLHVGRTLPEYMVPAAYVSLESLPLTVNGKVDRRALPVPDDISYVTRTYEAPRGEVEQTLARIWSELLKVERVGRHDNFFMLGGHSLLVVRLIDRMRLAGLHADVRTLFTASTLMELAEAVGREALSIVVPPNGIVAGTETITPAMLPLATLNTEQIESIVARVPGGARNVQDIYPLAPLQEGLLFHHLLATEGDPYALYAVSRFDSRERVERYVSALQRVIDRHDILRTSVVWEGLPEAVQVVWRNAPLHAEEVVLDPADGEIAHQVAARFDPRHYRLDVRAAPMMHVAFAQEHAGGSWVLVHLFHHLVLDHTALGIVQDEIAAYLRGEEGQLPEPVPFRTVVAQARLGVSREEHEAFFRAMLEDVSEPTLPFGLANVQGDGSDIAAAYYPVDSSLSQRLRECARRFGVSAASVCHLAWARVLSVLSGRDDVVFGTVLFGRMQGGAGAHRGMGLFLNTLPVRVKMATSVEVGVRQTHAALAQLMYHEHAPLVLAQHCSGVAAPAPLFSALLNYRHFASEAVSRVLDGVQPLEMKERSNYPVALSVNDFGEDLSLSAQVDGSLDAQRVCGYMNRALEELVEALERAPKSTLNELRVLPDAERHQVLVEWNTTETAYPSDRCVHELFEEQVARTPDAIALMYRDVQVSYGELNARANRLAHYLRSLGVGPDTRVVLCFERSIAMVVGVFAVLKAGGAYVPLDPSYPLDRLRYMLADSAPVAVLTHDVVLDSVQEVLREGVAAVVDVEADAPRWSTVVGGDLGHGAVRPDDPAYVMYTSGSTGAPKGVVVEHRSVANYLHWMRLSFDLHPGEPVLQKAPFSFDVSVWEMFWPLVCGAKMILAHPEGHKDPAYLTRLIRSEHIEQIHFVPSMLQAFLEHEDVPACTCLRRVFCGGEQLHASSVRRLRERLPSVEVYNTYGPTEATVTATTYACSQGDMPGNVPIGRPPANVRAYVLDALLEPVPVGVAGELHIGGVQVARGYLNRPELTAERFVPSPFVDGDRLYKTGDVVRYLSDGTIEYVGRNDFQVKIRGFRIELGEIESALCRYAGIRDAVVVARAGGDGEKRLIAYYLVADAAVSMDTEQLRLHVANTLPEYMVPAAYVSLESMPLTVNGKVDRNALPAPDNSAYVTRTYEAPQGEVEQTLARIWCELLKVERVGRHDNFFELGGHSLLAVRVLSRLRAELKAELSLSALFAHPVLKDCAVLLAGTPANVLPAITAVDRTGPLPLSYAQQRMWFLSQLDGVSEAYHIPQRLRIQGKLDRVALRRAVDRLIVRHESLRTTFAKVDGTVVQCIGDAQSSRFALVEHDLRGHPAALEELRALSAQEAQSSFDLQAGPLVRGRLIRMEHDAHVLLLTMHHIVSDGWSTGVFVRELNALYESYRVGGDDPLAPLPVQYADYAVWQRNVLSDEVLAEQSAYWKEQLLGAPPMLELRTDHVRPLQQDLTGGWVSVVLDARLTAQLKSLSQRHGTTLFMTLLAGWGALLSRLAGQDDVVIGTPVANRHRAGVEDLIGFFVNTLAVRLDYSGRPTVSEVLDRVKRQSLQAQEHQDLPFEHVVELVNPPRSLSHTPVFQVMFAWQNTEQSALDLGGLQVTPLGVDYAVAKFDLTLELMESAGCIRGSLQYATSLFERETMQRYVTYLSRLFSEMVVGEDADITRIAVMPPAERQRVLVEWNTTDRAYPSDRCIHELFEEQVARTPDAVAVVHEAVQVSYGELNARANRLAHYLRSLGVGPESRVALCMERSLGLVVAELAVLKTGAAYVPLEEHAPLERLVYLVEDSQAAVVLHDGSRELSLGGVAWCVDIDSLVLEDYSSENVGSSVGSQGVACIMYTSGSTGEPKGVMVAHRAVNRLVINNGYANFGASDRVAFISNPAFDASTVEVWAALLTGGCVVVIARDVLLAPERFRAALKNQHVTILLLTVGLFQHYAPLLADVFPGLRYLIVGGDVVDAKTIAEVLRRGAPEHLLAAYGPTEGTTFASTFEVRAITPGATIPIGRPIGNTRVYILDERLEPVPIGTAGELYIGGAGVALGYWNRAELTSDRFLASPFVAGDRLYKTGDLARFLSDGTMEFLGRNDSQVKIRGFRIELGEIESRLSEHELVGEVAVVVREDVPGEKRLVAYYTREGGDELSIEDLRSHLLESLPEYMVPAAYVHLESLPLTANGKVDRKALPEPDLDAYAVRQYEQPLGGVEQEIAKIWCELLNVDRAGRNDGFFELGGHSLLAVRLISRIRQLFNVELSLLQIFARSTLIDIARVVSDASRSVLPAIEPVIRTERLALSFAQQRLWFLTQMDVGNPAYHISFGLRLVGDLDRVALANALDAVVLRHEALRTTFGSADGEPFQRIHTAKSSFCLVEDDIRSASDRSQGLKQRLATEAVAAFDLETGPLVRGRLIAVDEAEHVLLITMHHIVSDGWSVGVLLRELSALYASFRKNEPDSLPELKIQYADYAAWQREHVSGGVLEEQVTYWRKALDGIPALHQLPTDRARPARRDHSGSFVSLALDAELTTKLQALSRRHGTTLFMTMLTAWGILLGRLSGESDVVVGTPVAGRNRAEIEGLIGFFVNTLVLRLDLSGNPSVGEMLGRVKAQTLAAQTHQDLPFEQIVEIVHPVRSLAHSPLFQVMFAWQSNEAGAISLPGLEVSSVDFWNGFAKFDLTLNLREAGGRIVGGLEYATSLFDQSTIERYLRYLRELLTAMVADDRVSVERIPMLPDAERHQILVEWNATETAYPSDRCIHELFEERVALAPDAVAVLLGDAQLTYGELNAKSNQLAQYLRTVGVKPGERVALCFERSLEMVVGLLAVLKAGGAYVPLDAGYPIERLSYMVHDSAPALVLTHAGVPAAVRDMLRANVPLLDVVADAERWSREPASNPDRAGLDARNLAYVIYTSGSTGRPKGAMIGRPVANTRMYVLDAHMEPVPIGVSGDLYVGGVQVGRGYLNRPELTAERFVASPFAAGDRLYKTGDVARYLSDGNIEYLGRSDFQVKIRGFRIELGEIEAQLGAYPGVREAVVVALDAGAAGEKRLVAYFTADAAVAAEALREHLLSRLPEYMVPAAYVPLPSIPLMPNGKLDREALRAPEGDAYALRAYEAPTGEIERTIARIWSELLGVGEVGRNDNFFELGGHSLLVVRMLSRMRSAGLYVDIAALFTAATLQSLADVVGAESDLVEVPANGIVPGSKKIVPEMLSLW